MKIGGCVALITGGARGLGRAFAEEILQNDGKVNGSNSQSKRSMTNQLNSMNCVQSFSVWWYRPIIYASDWPIVLYANVYFSTCTLSYIHVHPLDHTTHKLSWPHMAIH